MALPRTRSDTSEDWDTTLILTQMTTMSAHAITAPIQEVRFLLLDPIYIDKNRYIYSKNNTLDTSTRAAE